MIASRNSTKTGRRRNMIALHQAVHNINVVPYIDIQLSNKVFAPSVTFITVTMYDNFRQS